MGDCRYATLIASLPWHGPLFGAKRTPISRVRLEHRLRMLDEDDHATLQAVEESMLWMYQPLERSDAELVTRVEYLMAQLDNALLCELLRFRLEVRTAVAALRRRHAGEEPPGLRERWGYGRWLDVIRRNWNDPSFRLQGVFPWINEASRLLAEGRTFELERLLLSVVWEHLGRCAEGHHFDFEAVVIYVLRWNIIDRWTHYDGQAAAVRFGQMVDHALAPLHDTLFTDLPSGTAAHAN